MRRYIWIWQLNNCEKGDIKALIEKAKSLGAGYIVKTHDGVIDQTDRYWRQSGAIGQFKAAGVPTGAWGYLYGRDIRGEIVAVKRTAALKPDFYILDVEAEWEHPGMSLKADQLCRGIRNLPVPFGYTSFPLASLHQGFPYSTFSKYCKFAAPQIYWMDIGRPVKDLFNLTLAQYKSFGLPVYPVGEICNNATVSDIHTFDKLSSAISPVVSYWDYQHATGAQLEAVKAQA